MKPRDLWIAVMLTAGGFASLAPAAVVPLAGLTNPTLQTLIDLGTPVSVGGLQFSNFGLINALPGSGVSASQIQVQPYTIGGSGLQFISSWFAADGTYVDEVLTFNVQAINPNQPMSTISLLSNGTAPVPASGTFNTDTLVIQLPGGATAAPVLSTYNDGVTTPIDTTKPDVNYAQTAFTPQTDLQISDTIFESSTAPGSTTNGGVATESILQNAFVNVPEPGRAGWIFVPFAALVATMNRRNNQMIPRP